MIQVNEEMILTQVKEGYSKKYTRLFNKFKKDNPQLESQYREIAESVSVNIDEIENLAKEKTKELLSLPVAYYDINEEVSEITDKLINKVKSSLDETVKVRSRKAMLSKINAIAYQSNEYKTLDKDVERFDRFQLVIDEMKEEFSAINLFINIQTSDKKVSKEKEARRFGVIRFKGKLALFSMKSIDVIDYGKPSQASKIEGTYVLSEIVQGESVLKGWTKMLKDLAKYLDIKTIKEKETFAKFNAELLKVLDLRTKISA